MAIQRSDRCSRMSITLLASAVAATVAALVAGCGGDMSGEGAALDQGQAKTIRILRPPGKWVIDMLAWIPSPGVLTMAAGRQPPYVDITLFTVRVDGSGSWRRVVGLSQPKCRGDVRACPGCARARSGCVHRGLCQSSAAAERAETHKGVFVSDASSPFTLPLRASVSGEGVRTSARRTGRGAQ